MSYKLKIAFSGFFILFSLTAGYSQESTRPNVILIMTDDQGYGDFGFTGNDQIKTPTLDKLAKESLRFTNFYVSPVCAPTRASLMTGRYSLRTGIRDTYNGGAIMASNEITIAEMLKQSNYVSGVFGKWHLGDNYPSRPNDQGFDESLIHLSGGMGQVGDFTTYYKGDKSYFDPELWHNGKRESYNGYCSDIFTDNAIGFIENNKDNPFFCYLSFNAPHTPLQVPDKYYNLYKNIDPSITFDKNNSSKVKMSEKNKEDARKVFAMVTNIDDNIKRVLDKLIELKIEENTILIFMTDNGPQQLRYVGGMKGLKGSVYRGGTRTPFLLRFPSQIKGDRDIDEMAAHLDVLPTLASLCKVDVPKDRILDGKNLLPIIKNKSVDWQGRSLFSYWTRRFPELYDNIAIQNAQYKLVGKTNYNASIQNFELYDIMADPNEQNNIISSKEGIAVNLKNEMDKIYNELIESENLKNKPLIAVGNKNENPVFLNRNDADGQRGIWNQEEIYGKWNVKIEEGLYNFKFKFIKPVKVSGRMVIEAGNVVNQLKNDHKTDLIEMNAVRLPKMEGELIPFYAVGGKNIFPFWVEIKKVD